MTLRWVACTALVLARDWGPLPADPEILKRAKPPKPRSAPTSAGVRP